MLLCRHASLGHLPALVVLTILGATVAALGSTILLVVLRTPVLLVPEAEGVCRLAPAQADPAYQRAFAAAFLQQWETWNVATCASRRAVALAMLDPSVRQAGSRLAGEAGGLERSLGQSQDLVVDALTCAGPQRLGSGLSEIAVHGRLTRYFGGVGGEADAWSARVWLRRAQPCAGAPWCLAVAAVAVGADPGAEAVPAAATADAPALASASAPLAASGSAPMALAVAVGARQ